MVSSWLTDMDMLEFQKLKTFQAFITAYFKERKQLVCICFNWYKT